mmetsp:Transcript_68664/g.159223  ORF Transcript_68664/g.159223 Transcript_68664/m.159223 type:complete len:113 (-) Transcript_68664:8-346(-)
MKMDTRKDTSGTASRLSASNTELSGTTAAKSTGSGSDASDVLESSTLVTVPRAVGCAPAKARGCSSTKFSAAANAQSNSGSKQLRDRRAAMASVTLEASEAKEGEGVRTLGA